MLRTSPSAGLPEQFHRVDLGPPMAVLLVEPLDALDLDEHPHLRPLTGQARDALADDAAVALHRFNLRSIAEADMEVAVLLDLDIGDVADHGDVRLSDLPQREIAQLHQ